MTFALATSDRAAEDRTATFCIGLLLGIASAIVGVPGGFAGLRIWHLLLCVAFLMSLWRLRMGGPRSMRIFPHDLIAAIFTVWGLLVELIDSTELDYQFRPVNTIVAFLFILAYWSVRLSVFSSDGAIALLRGLIAPSIPIAIIAAAQAGSVEVSRWILTIAPADGLANRVADGRLIRATAFVGHWTGLGFYFCAMLAASIILMSIEQRDRLSRYAVVTACAAVVGAFSSLTLSAILTAGAILACAALSRGNRVGPPIAIGASALSISYYFRDLLSERLDQQTEYRPEYVPGWVPNTIAFRYKIWTEETIPVAMQRPLWGWGSSLYSSTRDRPYQLRWFSAESQWLAQFISAGFVSMVLLALLVGSMFVVGIRLARRRIYGAGMYSFAVLVFMSFLASATAPVFINRGLTIPLWVLFGLICALETPSSADDWRSLNGSMPVNHEVHVRPHNVT